MANSFLDKFRSGLKAIQSRQILILLSREKDRGNISTVEEFKQRLNELTSQLNATTISPTLQLFLANIGDRIDSDSFNFMLERIEDDLVAAFQEANTIDEVLDAHETIVNDVVLKNLELAINDLESKIEALEFINKTSLGLDNAIFNTFRVTQNARSSFDEGVIFIDPKTGLQNDPSIEASIDFIGEKLIGKTELSDSVAIANIRQVFDAEARGTELSVEFRSSNINNIIDNRIGTFWLQSTLLSKPLGETGLLTKLELDLGSVRTINFVQIEPILLAAVNLYKISYLDENNQFVDILIDPIEIQTTNKLFFNNISTRKLYLTFQNKNFFQSQFELKPNSPLITVIRDPLNSSELVESIKPDLLELVNSPITRDILGLNQESDKTFKKFYEYFIGFDNIRVGLYKFNETSIFVSKTETINKCGQVALKTLDKRPILSNDLITEYTEDTQPISFSTPFYGSIEYYLIKRDFSETDVLLNSYTIPVLPLNVSQIRHERLVLDKKSLTYLPTNDIGRLQFYTEDDILTMKVYRNGVEMTPTDLVLINPSETDGWLIDTDNTQIDPDQGKPMVISIKIQQPNPSDIYTVSYTPSLSTTRVLPQDLTTTSALLVDLNGLLDAWLGPENIIYFSTEKNGTKISYSLLNLAIILRRNSANVTLTPVVEEYLLATATQNMAKFGGSV